MADPVDDLRGQLTDAALRRSWEKVNQLINDLEERGPLWEQMHGYCGPANRMGSLGEWLKGCSDWEPSGPVGASV